MDGGCVCDGLWMCMYWNMDVYVIYPVLCVDIYVISLFVLMESKKQKKAFFPLCRVPHSAKIAECRDHGTWQIFFLKKRKKFFAECKSMALGKEFSKKNSLPSAAEVALGKRGRQS